MDVDLDALARTVAAGTGHGEGTRVVAVDGPSGSGKTVLARTLADRLSAPGGPVPVVRLDDVYPGWDGLTDGVSHLVEWVLEPLAAGEQAGYRRFDWELHQYAEWHQVPPARLVLVDGVGSGALACAPFLSLLVWVEAPAAQRYGRAMARDGDGYRPHWHRWAQHEASHFRQNGTRERADVRVWTAPR